MAVSSNKTASYRIPVPQDYEDVFSHFYYAANDTAQPEPHRLLPSFQQIMVFIFGQGVKIKTPDNLPIQLNRSVILGPVKKALEYTLLPGTQILVLNFKPGSFYRFFGATHNEHTAPLNPDSLTPENCFTDLWENLRKLPSPEQKIAKVLTFSKPYLKERPTG